MCYAHSIHTKGESRRETRGLPPRTCTLAAQSSDGQKAPPQEAHGVDSHGVRDVTHGEAGNEAEFAAPRAQDGGHVTHVMCVVQVQGLGPRGAQGQKAATHGDGGLAGGCSTRGEEGARGCVVLVAVHYGCTHSKGD